MKGAAFVSQGTGFTSDSCRYIPLPSCVKLRKASEKKEWGALTWQPRDQHYLWPLVLGKTWKEWVYNLFTNACKPPFSLEDPWALEHQESWIKTGTLLSVHPPASQMLLLYVQKHDAPSLTSSSFRHVGGVHSMSSQTKVSPVSPPQLVPPKVYGK